MHKSVFSEMQRRTSNTKCHTHYKADGILSANTLAVTTRTVCAAAAASHCIISGCLTLMSDRDEYRKYIAWDSTTSLMLSYSSITFNHFSKRERETQICIRSTSNLIINHSNQIKCTTPFCIRRRANSKNSATKIDREHFESKRVRIILMTIPLINFLMNFNIS